MIRFGDHLPQLILQFQQGIIPEVLSILITISFPVLAFILATLFFPLWVDYVRSKNFLSIKYTILEVKLPRETLKSPLAMELFLHSIHNTSDGSKLKQYWLGETRPWYSLEMISTEGRVKFMIWTEDRRKISLMSALYAQYPGIEFEEVEDYARQIRFNGDTMKMYSTEMEFTLPDPYPIKTYVDYGLDKDPKEEFKIDPLSPVLEYLGSVGQYQHVWIQLLVRAHTKEQNKSGFWFTKTDAWKDEAKKLVDEILVRDPKTKVAGVPGEDGQGQRVTISPGEQDTVKAIERSVSKLPFDVGIRCMYLATKKEVFDTPFGIGGIIGGFKHFSSENLNGFKPKKIWTSKIDAPWHDFKNIRRNRQSNAFLMAYRLRSYFYTPFESKPLVLNTEELATIYHFPGSTAPVPTLQRVPSKKSEAPANLPV